MLPLDKYKLKAPSGSWNYGQSTCYVERVLALDVLVYFNSLTVIDGSGLGLLG